MILKYSALQLLADIIGANVPELFGRICVAPAGPEHNQVFPQLYIRATRWRFSTREPSDVNPLTGDDMEPEVGRSLWRVGDWEADAEVVVGATTAQERYAIADKVEQLFFNGTSGCTVIADPSAFLRPGVILADIPGAEGFARCAYLLDDETWEDEKVFSQELYSKMNIKVEVPVLASRFGLSATTITNLRLALSEDLTPLGPGDPLPSDAQIVHINSDGSITAA